MNELPLSFPIAPLIFAIVAYAVMRYWSYRLDREEEEAARRKHSPAE